MRLLDVRLVLVALLVVSLAFKAMGSFDLKEVTGPQDVSGFLDTIGFSASREESKVLVNDGWTEARQGNCLIHVTQVSHQGWERQAVREYAGDGRIAYFYAGHVYPEHPLQRAMTDYYMARLKGYLHLPFEAPRVWALVAGPGCPESLINDH